MPLALTQYQTILLVVAAVFIAFALIVALVVPRSRPGFPANRLGIFIGVCVVLFIAQLSAVLLLAQKGEGDEPAVEGTSSTPTETTPTETTPAAGGQGDPVAGKEVFLTVASPACESCHTLSDAGSTGTVGPDLDSLAPTYDQVLNQVTNGGGPMPAYKGSLTEAQIQDVAAYVSSVAGS